MREGKEEKKGRDKRAFFNKNINQLTKKGQIRLKVYKTKKVKTFKPTREILKERERIQRESNALIGRDTPRLTVCKIKKVKTIQASHMSGKSWKCGIKYRKNHK